MTVSILDVSTRKFTELIPGAARVTLPPNRLLYVMQDGSAMLADFDAATGTIRGTPRQVFGGVRLNLSIAAQMDVSADGRVILFSGGDNVGSQRQVRVARVDRTGRGRRQQLHMGRCLQLRVALARRLPPRHHSDHRPAAGPLGQAARRGSHHPPHIRGCGELPAVLAARRAGPALPVGPVAAHASLLRAGRRQWRARSVPHAGHGAG